MSLVDRDVLKIAVERYFTTKKNGIPYTWFLVPPDIVFLIRDYENTVLLQSSVFDSNQSVVEKDLGSIELVVI
jgi:hypothetical protein